MQVAAFLNVYSRDSDLDTFDFLTLVMSEVDTRLLLISAFFNCRFFSPEFLAKVLPTSSSQEETIAVTVVHSCCWLSVDFLIACSTVDWLAGPYCR